MPSSHKVNLLTAPEGTSFKIPEWMDMDALETLIFGMDEDDSDDELEEEEEYYEDGGDDDDEEEQEQEDSGEEEA